ncbi:hypothetical protein H9Q69_012092 [Fusarium xylarioides]|nr:hypothetical protein H9Q69_012092 [Fusarium xylarioides]
MALKPAYLTVEFSSESEGKEFRLVWRDERGTRIPVDYVRYHEGVTKAHAILKAIKAWDRDLRSRVEDYNTKLIIALARMRIVRFAKAGTQNVPYIPDHLRVNGRILPCKLISDEFAEYFNVMKEVFEGLGNSQFKLLFVDEKDLPDHNQHSVQLKTARALMLKANKTPVQILGDYLRQLWRHCRQNIVRAEGRRMMTVSTVHLVVTLPAIWPYYTRPRMTEALGHAGLLNITKAGHTTLDFISEPEAAALTFLKENADRFNVRVGDHFVICDAGGGTVLDPLIISESVKGDGGLCGAMFLDEKFLNLLKETIPFEAQKSLDKQTFHRIMESDWEGGLKSSFCETSGDLPLQLSYDGLINTNFFPSKFIIDVSEIREKVFDPVVKDVKQLVQKQVNAVKHKYKKKPKGNLVDVLQQDGEKPWTAVLRGAVLHGLARTNHASSIKVTVASRVSRHSYGTLVNISPFDPKDHDAKDRAWDAGLQEFLAGSSVSAYDPVFESFWQDLTSPDDDLQIDIVTSDASTPPTRKDDSVKPMCIVKASELPRWDTIPVWTNEDGEVLHRITYELRMISDGSSLDFQVFYKNKSIASGSVAFDSISQNDTDDEDDVQMGSPQPLDNNSNGNNIIDMTDTDSDSDYVEAEE